MYLDKIAERASSSTPSTLKNREEESIHIHLRPVHLFWMSTLVGFMILLLVVWSHLSYPSDVSNNTVSVLNGSRPKTYISSIHAPNLLEEDPSTSRLLYSQPISTASSRDPLPSTSSPLSDQCMNQVIDFVNDQSINSDLNGADMVHMNAPSPLKDDSGRQVLRLFLSSLARTIFSFPRTILMSFLQTLKAVIG